MNKKYYSISEYAEIKGVSKQAIYKKLNTTLKDCVEIVDGKKMLKIENLNPTVQPKVENSTNDFQHNSTNSTNDFQPQTTEQNTDNSLVSFLKEQIDKKDKLIEQLQESEKKKDEHIQELGERIADLFAQSNELQRNNQVLIKMLGDGKTADEIIVENAGEEKEETKRRWFNKIFK